MSGERLLLTGASGFLGSRIAEAALAAGHPLRAVVRRADFDAPWSADAELHRLDLSHAPAEDETDPALDALLDDVDAVIHAAAAFTGDDRTHARDTVAPTRRLLAALVRRKARAGAAPRLILIGSLAVYGYAALPDGAQLDETTPLESSPERRDAYCRGKLAQEALALEAAQRDGLEIRVLRPGSIIAEDRPPRARLGLKAGPVLFLLGPDAVLPTIDVDACAADVLASACAPVRRLEAGRDAGAFEAVNLIDDDPPLRSARLAGLQARGEAKRTLGVPLKPLRLLTTGVSMIGDLSPGLIRRVPGVLRAEAFEARFKPLIWSTARRRDLLAAERPAEPAR